MQHQTMRKYPYIPHDSRFVFHSIIETKSTGSIPIKWLDLVVGVP